MKNNYANTGFFRLLTVLLLFTCLKANAQYQFVFKDGRKILGPKYVLGDKKITIWQRMEDGSGPSYPRSELKTIVTNYNPAVLSSEVVVQIKTDSLFSTIERVRSIYEGHFFIESGRSLKKIDQDIVDDLLIPSSQKRKNADLVFLRNGNSIMGFLNRLTADSIFVDLLNSNAQNKDLRYALADVKLVVTTVLKQDYNNISGVGRFYSISGFNKTKVQKISENNREVDVVQTHAQGDSSFVLRNVGKSDGFQAGLSHISSTNSVQRATENAKSYYLNPNKGAYTETENSDADASVNAYLTVGAAFFTNPPDVSGFENRAFTADFGVQLSSSVVGVNANLFYLSTSYQKIYSDQISMFYFGPNVILGNDKEPLQARFGVGPLYYSNAAKVSGKNISISTLTLGYDVRLFIKISDSISLMTGGILISTKEYQVEGKTISLDKPENLSRFEIGVRFKF